MDPNENLRMSQQPSPAQPYMCPTLKQHLLSGFRSALSNCICCKLIILYPGDTGMGKVPRALGCFHTSEMFQTQPPKTRSSANLGVFLGELVFDVEPPSSSRERCHLDTNYVVIAVITLEEGVNLPFVCPKKCQPGQVGHHFVLFCLKKAVYDAKQ